MKPESGSQWAQHAPLTPRGGHSFSTGSSPPLLPWVFSPPGSECSSQKLFGVHITTHPVFFIATTGVSQCPLLCKCNSTSAPAVYSTLSCCINNLLSKISKNLEGNIKQQRDIALFKHQCRFQTGHLQYPHKIVDVFWHLMENK